MICPTCHGPMKPLFTGSFCPRDCDRPAAATSARQHLLRGIGGSDWLVERVEVDGTVPQTATHGWGLYPGGLPGENERDSIERLIEDLHVRWKRHVTPGYFPPWRISDMIRHHPREHAMLTFTRVS